MQYIVLYTKPKHKYNKLYIRHIQNKNRKYLTYINQFEREKIILNKEI